MSYTLGQAAKAVGMSKTSILRSIKAGRISAGRDQLGQWAIEPRFGKRIRIRKIAARFGVSNTVACQAKPKQEPPHNQANSDTRENPTLAPNLGG